MRELDRCEREIVYFADDSGSWQVGVLWERVLPAWFRSLSPAMEPHAWAELVVSALRDFGGHKTADIMAATHEIATPEQPQALAKHGAGGEGA